MIPHSAKTSVRPESAAHNRPFYYLSGLQLLPKLKETKLGLELLEVEPAHERVGPVAVTQAVPAKNAKQQQPRRGGGRKRFVERDPLTAWQEYAHALPQANEASFFN
jgi:hypothetical protein